MTLLEVLLALALLSLASAAAFAWIQAQGRASRRALAALGEAEAFAAALRLIDDDLVHAPARGRLSDPRTLVCDTLARAPGDPPGLHAVTWQVTADGTLVRRTASLAGGEVARVVSRRLSGLVFRRLEDGALIAELAAGGTSRQVRLWDGR